MGFLGSIGDIASSPFNMVKSVLGIGQSIPSGGSIPRISDMKTDKSVLELQKKLDAIPATKPIGSYTAKDMSKQNLPEYDLARQRINEQANVEGQGAQEALARRFAAMGGGMNSGAYIKQAELQNQDTQNRRSQALSDLDIQQAHERTALQQREADKEFQSGETARTFNAQQEFQDKVFRFDSASKLAQLDLAYKSADLNAATERYNAELNSYTARHSGGLLGAGGILGTGISLGG